MRRPAANAPGHAHELTFSCFRRFTFLQAERTCQWLADALDAARREFDFALWAYVFMPEHVHILLRPRQPEYDIAAILKAIKQPVGTQAIKYMRQHAPEWLARITVKKGTKVERRLWQAGGGFDRNVADPRLALLMIDYIHANPVRRKLALKAEDWKWSSAGWLEGKNSLRPDPIDFGGLTSFFRGEG
ncbi:MAG: transposase [Planctomycetes bacterium]|nr:transposase [Planctomycetota bacterium]